MRLQFLAHLSTSIVPSALEYEARVREESFVRLD